MSMPKSKSELLFEALFQTALRSKPVDIHRHAVSGPARLSFSQQRLWFLEQLAPGNPVYNVTRAYRLSGTPDTDCLTASIQEIVRRHDSLRTCFKETAGNHFIRTLKEPVFENRFI